MSTRQLEDEAESLIRRAAADRLPVDAGKVAAVADVVRRAHREGRQYALRCVRALLAEMRDDWGEVDPLKMRDALAEAVRDELEATQ